MDLSYWEKNTFFNDIDVTIIGSGIVGLCTALELKKSNQSLKILVLERGFLPYGASTRNAGFACFGSLSEILDDLSSEDEQEVIKRISRRFKGLKKLREMTGDASIGYEGLGGYEIFAEADAEVYEKCISQMPYINKMLQECGIEADMFQSDDAAISSFGFKGLAHMIKNKYEGQIDTGKMMLALLQMIHSRGIFLINGIDVLKFENNGKNIIVSTNQGFTFLTKKLLIASNGFARTLLPNIDVQPKRAQALITKAVKNLKVKGCFHYDKGYYYFRNVGDRILLGGARNSAFEEEATLEFGITDKIQNRLDAFLKEIILPDASYEIDQRWSGIMGFAHTKNPVVREISNNIFCAVGMGGMGIAIGSLIAEEAAKLILDSCQI